MNERGRRELEGTSLGELSRLLEGSGRASIVWECLRTGCDPFQSGELSKAARTHLARRTRATILDPERVVRADCGTTKLSLRLVDDARVETVVLPEKRRTTVCVSSQSGCARGCVFCQTATMGWRRNLTAGEIVGQVLLAMRRVRQESLPPVRNVVFMGMGEPLDNLDAVRSAIDILCDRCGLGIGSSYVTLSTVGTTPVAIRSTRDLRVRMAWSIHAVDDALRRELVPTTRHSMTELRDAFQETLMDSRRPLFVEMTLIRERNDALHHAEALAEFLLPFAPRVRINLLPMNPGREGVEPSTNDRAIAYRQLLRERGYFCALRTPRGLEAAAACGQLVASPSSR